MEQIPAKPPIIKLIQDLLTLEDKMDFGNVHIEGADNFALFSSLVSKLNNPRLYRNIIKNRTDWASEKSLSASILDYAAQEKDADLAALYFRSIMKNNLRTCYENYAAFVSKQIKIPNPDFVERILSSRHSQVINEFLYDPMFSDGYNGLLPMRFLNWSVSSIHLEGGCDSFFKVSAALLRARPDKKEKFAELWSMTMAKASKTSHQCINDKMTVDKWPEDLVFVMEQVEGKMNPALEVYFPAWKTHKQKKELYEAVSSVREDRAEHSSPSLKM